MNGRLPQLLDILEALSECYESKREAGHIFTLYKHEVGDVLRAKGFHTTDEMVWERLFEFNKTIKVTKKDDMTGDWIDVYWLCQPNLPEHEKDKAKGMPYMFRVGVVVNQLAELVRKRQLEDEQLRFWGLYKWGIVLAVVGVVCSIVGTVCAIVNCCHRP